MDKTLTDAQAIEALPKQRRFLIVMSLTVIGYYWLGLIVKDMQLSGTGFEIQNKPHALSALWTVWFWSLLRYWQRFYELLDEIKRDIRLDFDAEDKKFALRAALKMAKKLARNNQVAPDGATDVRIGTVGFAKNRLTADPILPEFGPTVSGGRMYRDIRINFSYKIEEPAENGVPPGAITASGKTINMQWPRFATIVHTIRSRFSASWRLPSVSEHIAPLVMAVLAIAGPVYDSHIKEPEASALTTTDTDPYEEAAKATQAAIAREQKEASGGAKDVPANQKEATAPVPTVPVIPPPTKDDTQIGRTK